MILQEADEAVLRDVNGPAVVALPMLRVAAVGHEGVLQRVRDERDVAVVLVVAVALAGQEAVDRVVEVVGPCGVEAVAVRVA